MWKLKRKIYDLKWIYDTVLPVDECIRVLTELQKTNRYSWSSATGTRLPENSVELVFQQPRSGEGKLKRTRYIAEFYRVEKGWTAIVLRFVDELFLAPPFTSLEEIDAFFSAAIQAHRRK